ncbi:hypothetical protein TPR58_20930 [Sphingomonas sp. HF-S3]|uniref:Uncharacterized protein n=1 Tax=Sphingomonas rustica TaxID=3103142 RepID=A0ABV0BG71_9SPHN
MPPLYARYISKGSSRFVELMMRYAIAPALLLLYTAAADAQRTQDRRDLPDVADVYTQLVQNPPLLTAERLPAGYKLGRCRLDIDGHPYISGRCAYEISEGGAFEFHGPRQVFSGVDYRKPEVFADEISTDYFVQVRRELLDGDKRGPRWQAFWNGTKPATHAYRDLGRLTKRGACYVNARTRICLWKQ